MCCDVSRVPEARLPWQMETGPQVDSTLTPRRDIRPGDNTWEISLHQRRDTYIQTTTDSAQAERRGIRREDGWHAFPGLSSPWRREFQFLGAGGRAEDHTVLGESWSILLTQPFLYFPHLLLVLISYSCFPFPSCFQASHTLVLEVWVKVV